MLTDARRLLVRFVLLGTGVVLLNFLIPRLLPGSPLAFSSGAGTDQATPLSAGSRAQLRAYYGLDDSVRRQFGSYLRDLSHGDLGASISRRAPVSQLILDRLPWTLGLLLFSITVAACAGTIIGVVAGWHPHRFWDATLVSVASAVAAIPEFLLAIGLLVVFSVELGWLPLFGGESTFANHGGGGTGLLRHAFDIGRHLTLPAAALALASAPSFVLIARDTTRGLQHQPYVTVARSKGLRERDVIRRHALPNMTFPLLNALGVRLGGLLGGALIVERVFSVPGLGLLAYNAIRARDYPVLQALFLLASLGVLTTNFLVEIVQLWAMRRRGWGGV